MATTAAPPPPADDQLAAVRECYESAPVTAGFGQMEALLVCGLHADHDGFLHWDPEDRIWWAVRA